MIIDDAGLALATSRPNLGGYIKQLWQRRFYIKADARSKAFKTGQDTFLGKAWIVADPLLQVSIYLLVFGVVLKASRGMDNFIGFLVIGVVYFGMLSKGLTAGSAVIKSNRNLIDSFNFPVAAVVFSSSLRQMYDSIAPGILAIVTAVLFQLDKPLHWTLIFVPFAFVIIHVFNLGVTFFVAKLTFLVPDLTQIVKVIARGLFFVSGVLFPISRFDFHPTLKLLVELNPYYQLLSAVRGFALDGMLPSVMGLSVIFGWTVGVVVLGFLYFWRSEGSYGNK
ncbi:MULTISPECIES: ABC transporter permease [Corynebacterium]|uniref:ABC transporter permease n=1 Tax=Corynebacterium TaxID=1716 RepID=UPI0022BA06E1|nr:ABC transporter permease [Corynebacterium hesseae]MCZ9298685.1 ABC transporter permease [Corynebacterium hesseae]